MDEKEGRQRAAALGLRTIGIIGVLMVARQCGRLESLAAEIARLRLEAGFFVDRALVPCNF
jgi:predicted nucleic acid-binding protein